MKILGLLIVLIWAQPALAYIDPGSGSAIMSAIAGFVVATGLIVKTYWYKIKSFFVKTKDPQSNSANSSAASKK